MSDLIDRQKAKDAIDMALDDIEHVTPSVYDHLLNALNEVPSAQLEVVPHKNYRYLSDYWCECGCHLGKQHDVKYCPDCGKKVKWDE